MLKQWIWSLGLCATLIELELSIVLSMVFNLFPMFFSCVEEEIVYSLSSLLVLLLFFVLFLGLHFVMDCLGL